MTLRFQASPKRLFANGAHAGALYGLRMRKPRIAELRKRLGISQAELAERLGMHVTNLNKIELGKAAITSKRRQQLSDFFEVPEFDLFATAPIVVPVKGYIGAGAVVEAVDAGDMDEIEAPADADPRTVAAIVRGDSMLPVYDDGTVLYWSRLLAPDAMVNRKCVVQLVNGRIYVKVLRNGTRPGMWTLQSINIAVSDMVDVHVEWAAPIDWVKPRY